MTRPWGSCGGTLRAVAACGPPLLCAGQQPKGGNGAGGRSFPLRCSRPLGPRPWAAHGRQRLRAPACPSRRWSTCSGSPRMRARAACPCAAELLASHSARVLVCSSRRFTCDAWTKARGEKKNCNCQKPDRHLRGCNTFGTHIRTTTSRSHPA